MALTKIPGELINIDDLDLTNVGTLHLDSIVSDASPAVITVGNGTNDTTTILGTTKIGTGFGQSPEVAGKLQIGFANSTTHDSDNATTATNSALVIGNYPGVEAANLQAGIQFNIHGGSQNRVATISAVAEASDSRGTALVFHSDDANQRKEKMRIAGDGTTTIGRSITTTYDNDQGYPLHVQATGGSQSYISISSPGADSGDTGLVIGHDGTGSRIINREDEPIIFHRASGESMTIESNGNVTIEDGNLAFASGHGIDFSATANSTGNLGVELLDDYEDGTWTPVLISGGSTNPTGGGAQAPSGRYTKIGNRCWVTFYVGRTYTNSPNGGIVVSGLPYTINASTNGYYTGSCATYNVSYGATGTPFLIPSGGGTTISLYATTSGGTWPQMTWESHSSSSGTYVTGMMSYQV